MEKAPATLHDLLSVERDSLGIQEVADLVLATPSRLEELVACFSSELPHVPWRAAWAIQRIQDANIKLLAPWQTTFVEVLREDHHQGVHRGILRYFAEAEIAEEHWPELLELSFSLLEDPKVPVAIRVHSMTIIYRISLHEPDLGRELQLVLEAHFENGSAGFKSRARKLLKKLSPKGRR